jgi:MFS family permease
METTLLGFLAVVLQFEWGLSTTQAASISAAVFAGQAVGSLALGRMGDKYGRKPTFLAASIIICVGGLMTCASQSYEQLLVIRFLVGFGVGGITVPYDIFAEFLPMEARGQCLMLVNYFWTAGSVLVTVLAYLTLGMGFSWRWFVFLCSIPCFLSAGLCILFVPESPRWLVLEGRRDEALRVLQKAAKMNGRKEISELFASDNMSLKKETPEKSDYLELVKVCTFKRKDIVVPVCLV